MSDILRFNEKSSKSYIKTKEIITRTNDNLLIIPFEKLRVEHSKGKHEIVLMSFSPLDWNLPAASSTTLKEPKPRNLSDVP